MPQPLHILIAGASIAGPATAYWFARLGSHVRVTVIERFPSPRTGGQNVDIRSVGVTVMRKMEGLEPAVRARRYTLDGITFFDPRGRRVARIGTTGDPDQQSLVSEYEIFRGELSSLLVDLTKGNDRVKYVYGEQVAAMSEMGEKGSGKMRVEFANGFPTTEFDLVVAADGSTSRTRAIGLGGGVRDHVVSMNCWAAYFTIDRDLLQGATEAQAWTAPGGKFLGVGPDPANEGNKVGWQLVGPRNGEDITVGFRAAMKKGDDAVKGLIAEQLKGEGWKTQEVMEGMLRSEDFYATESMQVKVPQLYKSRFTMVGDAGYSGASFGTGTSMALAGAYLLAGEIGKHEGDIMAGLRGYEERMRPIINDLQKIPPGMPGLMAPQTAWGVWGRNLLLSFIEAAATLGSILSPVFSWAGNLFSRATGKDPYNLPDYKWAE